MKNTLKQTPNNENQKSFKYNPEASLYDSNSYDQMPFGSYKSVRTCSYVEAIKQLSTPKNDNYHALQEIVEFGNPMVLGKILLSSSTMGIVRDVKLIAPVALGNDMIREMNCAFVAASKNCHTSVMEILLEHGADLHYDNNCALRKAVEHGHVESVDFLLQRGADVHVYNDSLAILSCKEGDYVLVMELLVKYGLNLMKKYQEIFNYCSIRTRPKCLAFLVKLSAENLRANPNNLNHNTDPAEELTGSSDGLCNDTDSYGHSGEDVDSPDDGYEQDNN